MKDTVEFHTTNPRVEGRSLIESVKSSMVPPTGSVINIRREDWIVIETFYSVDHADNPALCGIRANVFMEKMS